MIVAGIAKDLSFGVLALDAVVPAAAVELVEADELIAEGRTIHTCDEVGSVAMPLSIEEIRPPVSTTDTGPVALRNESVSTPPKM